MTFLAAPYEVKLPAFEGPLDLLLQLVEHNRLPITEVSLSQVTDSYLRRVEQMEVSPEEMSYFLVVASRLLLLKSRCLLPRPPQEAPETTTEDLAEQLKVYQRFKLAAARLRELEGVAAYTQLLPPPLPQWTGAVVSLPVASLERALRRSLKRLEDALPDGPPVPGQRLRLSDVVATAERRLRHEGRLSLEQLAGPAADRQVLVVAFLAALDLVRRRRARVVQDGLFAPVVLYPLQESE